MICKQWVNQVSSIPEVVSKRGSKLNWPIFLGAWILSTTCTLVEPFHFQRRPFMSFSFMSFPFPFHVLSCDLRWTIPQIKKQQDVFLWDAFETRPQFFSTGWWVGPGWNHQTSSAPGSHECRHFGRWFLHAHWRRCQEKVPVGVWKSPISVNELNTNRLNPLMTLVLVGKSWWLLGVDHQK